MKDKYDDLDLDILKELREDCRRSSYDLAELMGVSPNRITERIKRLKADGVIRRYQAQIAYPKLGFDMHALVFLNLKSGVAHTNESVVQITAMPEIASFYWLAGIFDGVAVIRTTTRDALSKALKKMGENKTVGGTRTDMIFETYKHPYEFNPLNSDKKYVPEDAHFERPKQAYDNLDLAILRELKQDSAIHHKELAKRLKTHQNTVIYRIKRLEECRVIVKYTADIDYYKLGYCVSALTMIKLIGTEIPDLEVVREICGIPEVKGFYGTSGTYDCGISIGVKNVEALASVLDRVRTHTKSIRKSTTFTVLHTYKDPCEYNPFLNVPLLKHEM